MGEEYFDFADLGTQFDSDYTEAAWDYSGEDYNFADPSDYGADWDTAEPIDEAAGLTQEQLGQGIVQETLGQQIVANASADYQAGLTGSSWSNLGNFLNPLARSSSSLLQSFTSAFGPQEAQAMALIPPAARPFLPSAGSGLGILAGPTRAVRSMGAFVLKNLRVRFPGLSISKIRSAVRTFGPVAVASVLGLTVEGLMQMMMTIKPRRMNPLNPKALSRSTRRLTAFHKKSMQIHSLISSIMGRGGARRCAPKRFPFRRAKKCR